MEIKFQSNAEQVAVKIRTFTDAMLPAIAKAMDDENLLTLGVIQRDYLNFPAKGPTQEHGLRHVSGKLFSSPIQSPAEVIGNTIESVIGSAIVYARIHELGFSGEQQVSGFSRKNIRENRYAPRKDGRGFTKKLVASGASVVRPFSRTMRMPARAPFGTALKSRTQNYLESIKGALEGAWGSAT